jgi:DASH complex subunit Dad4
VDVELEHMGKNNSDSSSGEAERGGDGSEQEPPGSTDGCNRLATGSLTCGKWKEINIQNMNIELVAQMFKNYQSNVLFHLEGKAKGRVGNLFLADTF